MSEAGNIKKSSFSAVIFLLLGGIFFCDTLFAFEFNIDPPRVDVVVPAGGKRSGYITASNYGSSKPIHVRTYIQDMIYLPDGSNDFLPAGSTPWSCAEWVKIRPAEFDIAPNRDELVRYQIEVPEGVEGGYYGVVFFEVEQAMMRPETGSNMGVRIGSLILVEVAETAVRRAKLTGLNLFAKFNGQAGFTAEYIIRNEGNIICYPQGKLLLENNEGKAIVELQLNNLRGGVFPGTSRTYTDIFKDPVPKGSYDAKVILDYGGKKLIGGQKKFTIE